MFVRLAVVKAAASRRTPKGRAAGADVPRAEKGEESRRERRVRGEEVEELKVERKRKTRGISRPGEERGAQNLRFADCARNDGAWLGTEREKHGALEITRRG